MAERRQSLRYGRWLPVTIDGRDSGLAVTHNASGTGALIVTARNLAVNSEISLRFRLPPDGSDEIVIRGRVVRIGPNRQDPDGLWPFGVAVAFDEASAELDRLLQAMAAREEAEPVSSPGQSSPPSERAR